MAITKKEFINRMAENCDITKKDACKAVETFIEILMDCLKEAGTVKLHNFGKFEMKNEKERIGRNPKTGEEYIIPEHKKVKFYASEKLADKIGNK
jgi:Bacterial nucleoid DNA-binding protein